MIPTNNTFSFHVGKDVFRWIVVLFIACLCIFLISCSSDSDNGYEELTVTGRVAKGPISHASVTIYKMLSDGSRGELVAGPFLTDSNGDWTWKLPDSNPGPFEVVARGGRFKNEATNEEVILEESDEMLGIIDPHESSSVAVTPLTHAILLSSKYMKEYDVSLTIREAVEQTISDATMAFGFNPTTERPLDPENIPDNATDAQKKYTALLGGISTLLDKLGEHPEMKFFNNARFMDLVLSVADDLSDGVLNGRDTWGDKIYLSTGIGDEADSLPELDWDGVDILLEKANSYAQSVEGLMDTQLPEHISLNIGSSKICEREGIELSIQGNGFLMLWKDEGENFYYSRSGVFHIDQDGRLVNDDNLVLQGWKLDEEGDTVGPIDNIQFDTSTLDVNIDPEGNIKVCQDDVRYWRISLAMFTDTTCLLQVSDNLYQETEESGQPMTGLTSTWSFGIIRSGTLESSELNEELALVADQESYFRFNSSGGYIYSRNPLCHIDIDRYIVNSSHERLTEFEVDDEGIIGGTLSEVLVVAPLTYLSRPEQTSHFDLDANLSSSESIILKEFDSNNKDTYNYSVFLWIYDCVSMKYTLGMFFQKTGDNVWKIFLKIDGREVVPTNGAGNFNPPDSWQVLFNDESGGIEIISGPSDLSPASENILTYESFDDENLWCPFELQIDISDLTQEDGVFAIDSLTNNGSGVELIYGISLGKNGVLVGYDRNGKSKVLGGIALFQFINPYELEEVGEDRYEETEASGPPVSGHPGESGYPTIASDNLMWPYGF